MKDFFYKIKRCLIKDKLIFKIFIDVEGINLDVFNQFDWTKWNPQCVCVEYETHENHMINVMTKNGYNLVYTSGENLVFAK